MTSEDVEGGGGVVGGEGRCGGDVGGAYGSFSHCAGWCAKVGSRFEHGILS